MKELDKNELQLVEGGDLHPFTEWLLDAIGFMGGEVVWGIEQTGSPTQFVASK